MVNRRTDVVRGFSPNLLSGLAFAGANRPAIGEGDDGILIAEEIALYYWGVFVLSSDWRSFHPTGEGSYVVRFISIPQGSWRGSTQGHNQPMRTSAIQKFHFSLPLSLNF
ncbi:MAG: hypothetical protein KDA84_00955, partial [Planctomycetaceae bacterium]|nr:hypothetical protein [Planctomycetaceae bacterium]